MQTGPSPVIIDPTTAFLALLSALTAYASQQKTNITKQARELCTSAIEKLAQEPDVSYALDLPIVRQAVLFRIRGHLAAVVHLILLTVLAGIAGLVLLRYASANTTDVTMVALTGLIVVVWLLSAIDLMLGVYGFELHFKELLDQIGTIQRRRLSIAPRPSAEVHFNELTEPSNDAGNAGRSKELKPEDRPAERKDQN